MTKLPTCEYDVIAASRYHTGEMEGKARIHFEAHLQHCAACTRAMEAQRRLDELVERLPTYRAPDAAPISRPRRSMTARSAAAVLAAAAAVVLLLQTVEERSSPWLVSEALAADAAALEVAMIAVREGTPQPTSNHEAVSRIPWLGFVTCSKQIAPKVEGIYICALKREAPLGRAGIRAGDVVIGVDGKPVTSDTAMYERLNRYQIGDEVELTVRAPEKIRRVQIALIQRSFGERHPFDLEWSPALVASLDQPRPPDEDLNLIFVPLSDSGRVGTGVPPGVLVARIPSRKPSEGSILSTMAFLFGPAGLRVGDVITAVQGRSISTRWDFLKTFSDVQHVPFTITVWREGEAVELHFKDAVPAAP
ncbi:MAG: PDZ domain-containing protein [Gemmatimonadetes bacterium]|jgi:S1-C subfamily serine protease|nr:PDZ domain-containing protein [Gemmatimonadota bacterium]